MTAARTYLMLAFVAIIFISLETAKSDNRRCGGNKTISDAGTHCPDCYNSKCVRCALQNITDCYCKEGYILVGNGCNKCVKPEDCPVCPGCSCAVNSG